MLFFTELGKENTCTCLCPSTRIRFSYRLTLNSIEHNSGLLLKLHRTWTLVRKSSSVHPCSSLGAVRVRMKLPTRGRLVWIIEVSWLNEAITSFQVSYISSRGRKSEYICYLGGFYWLFACPFLWIYVLQLSFLSPIIMFSNISYKWNKHKTYM